MISLYSKNSTRIPAIISEVVEVVENSPASQAGLTPESRIISVGEKRIKSVEEFVETVEANAGQEITITTLEQQYILVPREDPPEGEGRLGVMITDLEMKFYHHKIIYLKKI